MATEKKTTARGAKRKAPMASKASVRAVLTREITPEQAAALLERLAGYYSHRAFGTSDRGEINASWLLAAAATALPCGDRGEVNLAAKKARAAVHAVQRSGGPYVRAGAFGLTTADGARELRRSVLSRLRERAAAADEADMARAVAHAIVNDLGLASDCSELRRHVPGKRAHRSMNVLSKANEGDVYRTVLPVLASTELEKWASDDTAERCVRAGLRALGVTQRVVKAAFDADRKRGE